MNRFGIVLGAGMGTRMKSTVPKVLHEVMGKSMIEHVITALEKTNVEEVVVVTGHKSELVEARLKDRVKYAKQEEQLGTAHAVMMADSLLAGKNGMTMITYGDDPLLDEDILAQVFSKHENSNSKMTLLTNIVANPFGLGRIIRAESGEIIKITEQKDATEAELLITEINTGIACFDNDLLFKALKLVGNNNAQQEYYLTDLVEIIKNMGHNIESVVIDNLDGALGVNDRIQMANNARILRDRINIKHMENGVTLLDPFTTYIESDVIIGNDVIIEPNVHLKGNTVVKSNAFIGTGSYLTNASIGEGAHILSSYITSSSVGANTTVGPFAHLRDHAQIGKRVRIGNFVEVKKSVLADEVKAAHLAYMGDSDIGARSNISCGVITANYDGKKKHKTIIGEDVMIGSNVNLVAPVVVENNAYVAAGSTITKNVPEDALAIARSKQEIKAGYAKKI